MEEDEVEINSSGLLYMHSIFQLTQPLIPSALLNLPHFLSHFPIPIPWY